MGHETSSQTSQAAANEFVEETVAFLEARLLQILGSDMYALLCSYFENTEYGVRRYIDALASRGEPLGSNAEQEICVDIRQNPESILRQILGDARIILTAEGYESLHQPLGPISAGPAPLA